MDITAVVISASTADLLLAPLCNMRSKLSGSEVLFVTDGDAIFGVIEVRIRELSQLFNSLDPSPFRERDLDDDAEDFIVGWAQELPANKILRIIVHLPAPEAHEVDEHELAAAISNYFADRVRVIQRELKELFRVGWRHLSVGVSVLVVCFLASQFVPAALGINPISRAMQESLIIVGWVANWKPIEIFLYDWWPFKRRIGLYRRLQDAAVVVQADQ